MIVPSPLGNVSSPPVAGVGVEDVAALCSSSRKELKYNPRFNVSLYFKAAYKLSSTCSSSMEGTVAGRRMGEGATRLGIVVRGGRIEKGATRMVEACACRRG